MYADENVIKIKHEVIYEVAKLAFAGELEEKRDHIPMKMIPGPLPQFRCCIYKEREIIRQRIRLAEGKAPGPEDDDNVIQVISSACADCPISSYTVTENCQNCLGKACINACKFGAIEPGRYRSHIDASKCKECGRCAQACPYNAIAHLKRPCKFSCPVNAITYDEHGKIKRHRICESVIQVTERMNYSDVRDINVYEKEETCKRYEPLIPMFRNMEKLAAILRKGRKKQGSIDFDFQECKILLDKNGKPTDIVPYDRNVATRMIEEFMLAANKVVAEDYFWMDIPFLYRIHEYPDLEKIQQLSMITASLGYHIKVGKEEVHPRELQKLITSIEGTEEEAFLSRLTLRSMKRAKYSTNNEGHFGLATKYYCHFTSPIRRYPDLQIHRIIK